MAKENCKSCVREKAHLGEKIIQLSIEADHSKAETIINMPAPTAKEMLQRVLETVNTMGNFRRLGETCCCDVQKFTLHNAELLVLRH